MSMEICTEHDDTVVVYDGRGNTRRQCPLCQALADAETKESALNQQIEDVQAELDSAQSELDAAQSQNISLEATIDDLRGEIATLQSETK
jgi:peptidoglycan hydrolase CwlO-like protein